MGNLQCESRVCCKGESSANEEIRLAAESPNSGFHRSQSSNTQPHLPQDFPFESSNLPAKLADAANYSPVLTLKVLSSNSLPTNSVLRINPQGYEYSLRDAKDGATYFGCKKRAAREDGKQGPILNDIVMTIADQETAEKHRGRHFEIVYRVEKHSYWVRDLGIGFGAFVRLDDATKLKDNTLINVGESFIVANLETQERPRLKLKLFGGPCKGEVFYFIPEDYEGAYVRIGRAQNSEIVIDDNLISKCHVSIWHQEGSWQVSDGDAEKQRNSTNGTWYSLLRLYLNDSCELREGMVFKANQTLFEVHFL